MMGNFVWVIAYIIWASLHVVFRFLAATMLFGNSSYQAQNTVKFVFAIEG